jgi:hypothetical protein
MRRLALLLVPLALVLTACGGVQGGGGLSADPVAAAASKTRKQGSERVTFLMTGQSASGETLSMRGRGVFNNDGSGRMSFDVSSAAKQAHGDVVSTSDYVLYMRSDVFASKLPDGKSWVKFDLEKLSKKAGLDLASLDDAQQGNATSALDALRGAGETTKVGREAVTGVPTTHYHAIVDLEKAADQAPEKQRDALRKIVDLTGTKEMPIDVWIDRKGLVRKMEYEQKLDDRGGTTKLSYVLSGFGPSIPVEPPPSDQVSDILDLIFGGK